MSWVKRECDGKDEASQDERLSRSNIWYARRDSNP